MFVRALTERAFEAQHVSIDFARFSEETPHGVIQEPLSKIRIAHLTAESINVRILVPDAAGSISIPCCTADVGNSPQAPSASERDHAPLHHVTVDSVTELGSSKRPPRESGSTAPRHCSSIT